MLESETQDNHSTVESQLLELKALQSKGDSVYPKGIFTSQRYHPFLPYKREDDNLFFTASVLHILQGLDAFLTAEEKRIVDDVRLSAQPTFKLFKNKDGLDTYNFWQTSPSRHFPNGLLMNRFKHFQIPDDVDDTALVYLIENASLERVSLLREKLKEHANLAYKRAYNPQAEFRDYRCYSTFFGKEMYIEFDLCVLSNLMRVILPHFKSDLNEYDIDTLKFIEESVVKKHHLSKPFYSAPNYPTTPLILYHLARLIPVLPEEYKSSIEPIVKEDILVQLLSAQGMNKVILQNAALKLGLTQVELEDAQPSMLDDTTFYFFHAGMITAFENRLAQSLADSRFFHLRYTSKALNRALHIENLVLKKMLLS